MVQDDIDMVDLEGKMTEIDLMIFDFDGTLVSSGEDLATSVNYTLETLGIPTLETEKIIGFVGDGTGKLIERSLGSNFNDRFDEAMAIFMPHYSEHMLDTTTLYPGVLEVLKHFQYKKKLILTNKHYSFTLRMAEELKIADYFDDIIGADSTPHKKPDSRLIPPLLKRFRAGQDRTVIIGDGINDIILAKNAEVLSCAFLSGLDSRDDLLSLKPDFSCEDMLELKELFC